MADMQPLQKCLVLALCHNLHCIHVGSCWCLFWVCLCPWVCHWLFRGFEPWLIGRLVCTVQIRCTAGIDGRVPDCMLFISSMRRDRSEGNGHRFIRLQLYLQVCHLFLLCFCLGGEHFGKLQFFQILECVQILHHFLLHYICKPWTHIDLLASWSTPHTPKNYCVLSQVKAV